MTENIDFSGLKLLIVDDSPLNHRIVALSLRGKFKAIDSAYNGLDAFEKFKQNRYDVILMDVHMPVMNGFESAALIRLYEMEEKIEKRSFILAMTASDFRDDLELCFEKGMDASIGKPFVVANFLQKVQEKFFPLS